MSTLMQERLPQDGEERRDFLSEALALHLGEDADFTELLERKVATL